MIPSESCFQKKFRMSWACFINLLHMINADPIFYNHFQNPHQYVFIQLATATCLLGFNGNGAAVLRLKNLFQVGYRTINLQKPPINGNHYYYCKKRYSISLTCACHVNEKFTSYLASYPGSFHEIYVFLNIQISQQPEKLFDQNQFLLVDSAYT
ncbi:hypothetical protein VP01_3505g2, partial [Puccinia sorghi]